MSQIRPFCIDVVAPSTTTPKALSASSRKILSALVMPKSGNAGTLVLGDSAKQLIDLPVAIPLNVVGAMGLNVYADLADHYILPTNAGDGVNILGYELAP